MTVFSEDEDSIAMARRQVYDEVVDQLEVAETLKRHINNDDIVAVRLQQRNRGNVDKVSEADNGNSSTGIWNNTARNATISALSLLSFAVLVVAAVAIYRQKSTPGDDTRAAESIDSSCNGSIYTGGQSSNSIQSQFHEVLLSENDWGDEC